MMLHVILVWGERGRGIGLPVEADQQRQTDRQTDKYTVEPLNNGRIGTGHFVLYREVVLSLEVKMY